MNARGTSYAVCFVAAAALHGGLILGLGAVFKSGVQYAIAAGTSVELTLVEAAAASAVEAPAAPQFVAAPEPAAEPLPPEPEAIGPPPASPPPPAVARPKTSARARTAPSGKPGGGALGARTQARPNYLSNPPPSYPAASRQAGEQGVVLLAVSVTAQGRAASVRLVRSSAHPRLDEAARTAVHRWRFNPARIGTVAIASEVEVPVRFELK